MSAVPIVASPPSPAPPVTPQPPALPRMTRLFLERRIGSAVEISGPCRVIVTKVKGNRVWLAFESDASVMILRDDANRTSPRAAYLAPPKPLATGRAPARAS